MTFSQIYTEIIDFVKSDRGKKVLQWLQRLINVGVIIWLIYELANIGWSNFWSSLPVTPLFYILFALTFIQLPFFEIIIYRITWTFDVIKSIPVFLLKRFYNKDVVGYSGEVYFFAWAKKTLNKSGSEIFKIIKDNNIISSVASTLVSLGLLAAFFFAGQIKILQWIADQNRTYFIGGVLLVIIIIILFIRFRHYVISMPLKTAYKIFGIQVIRLILGQFINLLMYYVVMPDIPLYIWFTYIAIDIILSRIPFLPNRDLIFAGMGINLAGGMMISKEAIAGILITKSVLNKIGGAASFGIASLFKQSDIIPEPSKVPDKKPMDHELTEQEPNN